ncbi:LysR substrate-binding domain-containing protein [Moraxella nasovis]|uniref:LysR substrate-binding domain-containing protein n=1 Tax=Moraxella nasovis TaxID=2904121 RepID=UPI001F601DB9|nr:LysR substrate-binding domain-containing protein [Moraxella nasovis]UNU72665.1 LysR substrate-binding domain-containing protein [Moraxella nasovis]
MHTTNFRKYPSTTALQCFEAAGRHLSFTKAGKELHMTQSAVSKQVAQLEELLGVQLFYRVNQGIELSPAGQSYYKDTLAILAQIQHASLSMMVKHQEGEILSIACHPTFCAKWLIPALKGFGASHPLIHLDIKEVAEPLVDTGGVDMAFLFGNGVWVGMDAVKLFDEYMVAVCRPDYLPKETDSDKLTHYPLLQIRSRPTMWQAYFAELGVACQTLIGAKFDSFFACINAAMIGCGIALVPKRFVDKELNDGTLVLAINQKLQSQNAYYMTYQSRLAHTPKVMAMTKWISGYLDKFNTP